MMSRQARETREHKVDARRERATAEHKAVGERMYRHSLFAEQMAQINIFAAKRVAKHKAVRDQRNAPLATDDSFPPADFPLVPPPGFSLFEHDTVQSPQQQLSNEEKDEEKRLDLGAVDILKLQDDGSDYPKKGLRLP